MRTIAWILTLCVITSLGPAALAEETGSQGDNDAWDGPFKMKLESARRFPYTTMGGEYSRVTENAIPISPAGGSGIAIKPEKWKIHVDTRGDGVPDTKLSGRGGQVTVPVFYEGQERPQPYTLWLENINPDGWSYRRFCAVSGKVQGEVVKIIDDDSDGTFDDFGTDAVIVGKGRVASLLSPILNLKGKLYQVKISPDGRQVWTRPFEGASGTLDVVSKFRAPGKLVSAVFTSGDTYIDVARKGGVALPVGTWTLHGGQVQRDQLAVRLQAGNLDTIRVEEGEEFVLSWGGPLDIEFDYTVAAGQVKIMPAQIAVYGTGGEQYGPFSPHAFTPTVEVRNPTTGQPVNRGTVCLG